MYQYFSLYRNLLSKNTFLAWKRCCFEIIFVDIHLLGYKQSCSVSNETIDLTVTRGMLWANNLFKSDYIIILLLDQSVPLVTVMSNVSLLTEQLWS